MKTKTLEEKIIYQIFPRSFYDANNDGNGDLNGITKKLDYLQELGIDAIWLCPIYDTNFLDAGYDVKDYKSVWAQFGTIADFKTMVTEAAQRGIEIIIDIVLNHVSDEHAWFKKAQESIHNQEHNYFIWRDKLNEHEQKATSIFGGSAWEYVPQVNQYYFHLFSKSQVDLNWEHQATMRAMVDVINFWYQMGVKGFRLDAIKHIHKTFPDGIKTAHSWGAKVVPLLQKFMHAAFADKEDAYFLGEASGITLKEVLQYGKGKNKVATNFYNFAWWHIGWGKTGRNGYNPDWDYKEFVRMMKPFQESPQVTPELMTNFLSNHDTSRAISRWGHENTFWQESTQTLAMMLFALKGVPSIYYGEEIGMLNPIFSNRSEFKDVDALNAFKIFVDQEHIYTEDEMIKYHNINGRDNCRTPMQWNATTNAGFNQGQKPWIKVGAAYQTINVEAQLQDQTSILSFYKHMIKLRKSPNYKDIFIYGTSKFDVLANGVFRVIRNQNGNCIITFININNAHKTYHVPHYKKVIARSWIDNKTINGELRAYESIMFFVLGKA